MYAVQIKKFYLKSVHFITIQHKLSRAFQTDIIDFCQMVHWKPTDNFYRRLYRINIDIVSSACTIGVLPVTRKLYKCQNHENEHSCFFGLVECSVFFPNSV